MNHEPAMASNAECDRSNLQVLSTVPAVLDWHAPPSSPPIAAFSIAVTTLLGGATGVSSEVWISNDAGSWVLLDVFGPDGEGTTPHEILVPTCFWRLSLTADPSGSAVVSVATNSEPLVHGLMQPPMPELVLQPSTPSWPRHWPSAFRHPVTVPAREA